MTPIIEIDGVTKVYPAGFRQTTTALDDVTLSIAAGGATTTAIAGESGSGKTTLARLLLGFVAPTRGEVRFRGKSLARMSAAERRDFTETYSRSSRTLSTSSIRSTGSTTS